MRSDDPAPNRGGSRNFTETQQFLEYTFGPEKSGTINTFAIMKSGMKRVDSTGRSGPIPSAKAQKRLDDYKALVPDETSHELDGKALYTIGRGMAHGRVPIGDGAVEKTAVLRHAKSRRVIPVSPDRYEQVRKENDQLKENNEILHEENSIHRELLMKMFEQTGTEPPPELLQRLANIDARRQQATRSSHGYDGTCDNLDLEDATDDDHTWCGSEDDLECDDDGHFEGDSDDGFEGNGEDSSSLQDDGDDTCDEDCYSDHVSGDPTSSREMNMPTDGSGTRATN